MATPVFDRIDAELTRRGITWAELGRMAGFSAQRMTNWKSRGIPTRNYEAIADALGWSLDRLVNGADSPLSAGVAQGESHMHRQSTPPYVRWELLMRRPVQAEFQTEMPDASMAPDIPRGATVIFVAGADAEPGDFVLVTDSTGRHYIREYRELRPGHWQAHARNEAFLPLDSERDGLTVVAIFDGIRGRRSRR